jgi:cytochrome c553
MRKSINLVAWLCGVAVMLVSGATFAAEEGVVYGNAAKGKEIFMNGNPDKGVTACQTCHMDKAQGNDAMGTPRLAGQGTAYIIKQLDDIAAGRRVPQGLGAAMIGIAQGLSDQDRRNVAEYVHGIRSEELSDLNALKASGTPIGVSYKGQILVQYGGPSDPADGKFNKVSACVTCHQYNGRGAAPIFPMIGRQRYVYLVNQLKAWRDGSRANDPVVGGVGIMRAIAQKLTDEDINDAATFLATAPQTTSGNHHVPAQD